MLPEPALTRMRCQQLANAEIIAEDRGLFNNRVICPPSRTPLAGKYLRRGCCGTLLSVALLKRLRVVQPGVYWGLIEALVA